MTSKHDVGIRVCLARLVLVAAAWLLVAPGVSYASALHLTSADWARVNVGSLERDVFDLALDAASCAVESGTAAAPATLTVIDYSRPSTDQRLWVFDLATRQLLYEQLVAHGSGSGDNFATMFSNDLESHQSSLGLFLTSDTYVGKNGYSLRLDGLEPGVNDRARDRAIVVHGASYVSAATADALGRLGRSWGCPALDPAIARPLIDRIKGGGLLFAYYPDQNWLRTSKFLNGCAKP